MKCVCFLKLICVLLLVLAAGTIVFSDEDSTKPPANKDGDADAYARLEARPLPIHLIEVAEEVSYSTNLADEKVERIDKRKEVEEGLPLE